MNQLHPILILALLTILADATPIMFCKENKMCPEEECCIEGKCRPFISVGKKCDPFSQIMREQCPCAVGSSCTLTDTDPIETMSCQNIESPKYLEMVESRHLEHIESNTLEE